MTSPALTFINRLKLHPGIQHIENNLQPKSDYYCNWGGYTFCKFLLMWAFNVHVGPETEANLNAYWNLTAAAEWEDGATHCEFKSAATFKFTTFKWKMTTNKTLAPMSECNCWVLQMEQSDRYRHGPGLSLLRHRAETVMGALHLLYTQPETCLKRREIHHSSGNTDFVIFYSWQWLFCLNCTRFYLKTQQLIRSTPFKSWWKRGGSQRRCCVFNQCDDTRKATTCKATCFLS